MKDIFSYIDAHKQDYLDELSELIAIPSVSTDGKKIEECADYLAVLLKRAGINHVQVFPTGGNPIVYGDVIEKPALPTMLVYGHYDVQPADPLDEWNTDPFKLTVKNGRIYCRGSSDNKGQFYAQIKGMEAYRRVRGKLPINIKYWFEGEEEIHSPHWPDFAKTHKDLLKADACIFSDSCYHENGQPVLILGTRGGIDCEMVVHGASRDVHPMRNTTIPNPIYAMAELISSIRSIYDGRIKIDGFYDNVRPLTKLEIDTVKKIPSADKELKKSYGIKEFVRCPGGSSYYHNFMFEPGCNVHAVFAGWTGQKTRAAIPCKVTARFTFYLVPDQRCAEIQEKILKHIGKLGMADITEIKFGAGTTEAARTPIDSPYVRAAALAVRDGFGEYPVLYPGTGGAGPNWTVFTDLLEMPAVQIPFASADQNNHAPNENLILSGFLNGIKTSAAMIERFPR